MKPNTDTIWCEEVMAKIDTEEVNKIIYFFKAQQIIQQRAFCRSVVDC